MAEAVHVSEIVLQLNYPLNTVRNRTNSIHVV